MYSSIHLNVNTQSLTVRLYSNASSEGDTVVNVLTCAKRERERETAATYEPQMLEEKPDEPGKEEEKSEDGSQ